MARAVFQPNDALTYVPNANVEKNPFLTREAETGTLPTYEGSRPLLPKPTGRATMMPSPATTRPGRSSFPTCACR
ncbi:MAG: hypothetical protein IJA83_05325 [Clostridia bacterium]|nr:hypothetical protein [Clostridia bacterium]